MEALKEEDGRYLHDPVFPFDEKTLFEAQRIVIELEGTCSAELYLNGAEEYITVFAGQVEIAVSDERFRLSEGDSIRFRADVPHTYYNTGSVCAELSMLIYYSR